MIMSRRTEGLPFRRCALVFYLLLLPVAGVYAAPQGSGYKVVRRIPVEGEGGWDYLRVDPDAHRIYLSRGDHVMVVDENDGKVVGDIPNTKGIHGMALALDLGKGFTSNGGANTVTVFDLKTLKPLSEIKTTGENPDSIIYDPATKRVFTFNGKSSNSTAIDATNGQVVGTVALHGKPQGPAVDGKGNVFVNIEDNGSIVQFDAETLAVKSTWPLAPCEGPSALAMDTAQRRLFATCRRVMLVVNADTGKVVASLPIGQAPGGSVYDSGTGLLFASSSREGLISVIHQDSPDHYSAVGNVSTKFGAGTVAVDSKSHHVFTVAADFKPGGTPHPLPKPGSGKVSIIELGSTESALNIPKFPWPPPLASATDDITSLLPAVSGVALLLHDVSSRLVGALDQCGYDQKSFYPVPGGFALVTQLEQINSDGTSRPKPARWSATSQPLHTFSLVEYIKALLTAPPGRYRFIVFIVSSHQFVEQSDVTVSDEEGRKWLSGGLPQLPTAIGIEAFTSDSKCTVLVYEFEERQAGQQPVMTQPSNLTALDHVKQSGLSMALTKQQ